MCQLVVGFYGSVNDINVNISDLTLNIVNKYLVVQFDSRLNLI